MGSRNAYTHVGIILNIDKANFREKSSLKYHSACEEWRCKKRGVQVEAKFCSECGEPITPYSKADISMYKAWRLFDNKYDYQYECDFHMSEYGDNDFIIANIGESVFDNGEFGAEKDKNLLNLESIVFSEEIEKFRDEHSEMLSRMDEFFGEGTIEVVYGVCSHWN